MKPAPGVRGPVDASMTLLNEVMRRPLDPGYAAAAARKAAGEVSPRSLPRTIVLAALAIILGLTTAVAAMELRAPQPAAVAARKSLERQVIERRAETNELTTRVQALGAEIDTMQRQALSGASPQLLSQIQADQLVNGSVPVTGPGLVVTLTDGPPDPDNAVDPASAVQDHDLQRVVNSLWAGGAEAVAINDYRLTAVSAIRSAGSAILVDLQPLRAPYHVRAIGDSDAMQVALARGGTLGNLKMLSTKYGIKSSMVPQSELNLPGANMGSLYYAATQARPIESSQTPPGTTSPKPSPAVEPSGPGAGNSGQENHS